MHHIASEILISSYQVTQYSLGDPYEFILNERLQVLECVKIISVDRGTLHPIHNTATTLDGMLFELNHVRVNPKLDNSKIITCLTSALSEVGVQVFNQPAKESMAVCYRPLGEISDNVRFYFNRNSILIFLSPAMRPKLISQNLKSRP